MTGAAEHPLCSWTGVTPEGQEITCGRVATHVLHREGSRRIYTCPEHLAGLKAQAETGYAVHEVHYPHMGPGSFVVVNA